ncbi:MAG: Transposase [Herminiimonas sp.]|nr:Transposase [Herminiimonas sp.]
MSKLARAAMDTRQLTVIADRRYFQSDEILACHEAGIDVIVPKTLTSNATFEGRYGKADFIYDAQNNEYRCPARERLILRFTATEGRLNSHKYWSSHCQQCEIEWRCTQSPQRRVTRWEHEAIVDTMQNRIEQAPDSMRTRRQTVDHPYGTIKTWMGATHFLTRTLGRVSTDMSLHVLAYKRMVAILGARA